jgi:hypothetical protein
MNREYLHTTLGWYEWGCFDEKLDRWEWQKMATAGAD